MFTKTSSLLTLTSLLLLGVLPPASAVGRRVISASAARTGVKIPVTSQGVAITVPGEQILFIQLSHLSNITCTTDNGNMCAGASVTANILYVRRTNIYFQSQLPSPDGSTMLFVKTNGATCSSLCQLQLVPSSSVPPFTVLELGGVAALPPARKTPVAARAVTSSPAPRLTPRPLPKLSVPNVPIPSSQVKIDLLEPQNQIAPQVLPPAETPKIKIAAPVVALPVPIPSPSPTPAPKKKVQQEVSSLPKAPHSSSAKASSGLSKKQVAYVPATAKLGSRAIANLLVKGLLVANRTREIGFNTSLRARVQDLVRNLRKDLPLSVAQKRANVSATVVNRLIQLGSKK